MRKTATLKYPHGTEDFYFFLWFLYFSKSWKVLLALVSLSVDTQLRILGSTVRMELAVVGGGVFQMDWRQQL